MEIYKSNSNLITKVKIDLEKILPIINIALEAQDKKGKYYEYAVRAVNGEDMSAYKAAGDAENALLKAAVNQSVPRGSVQAMLDEYRKGTDLTPEEFAEGWSDGVHLIGRYGLKVDETAESAYNRLPQSAREASTRIGKQTAETERKAAEEAAARGEIPEPSPPEPAEEPAEEPST